jgi:hypothetical protein
VNDLAAFWLAHRSCAELADAEDLRAGIAGDVAVAQDRNVVQPGDEVASEPQVNVVVMSVL